MEALAKKLNIKLLDIKPKELSPTDEILKYTELGSVKDKYKELECPHMVELNLAENCVPCQEKERIQYTEDWNHEKKEIQGCQGWSDEKICKRSEIRTALSAAMRLILYYIQQYRLDACEEVLKEIRSTCLSLEPWSRFRVQIHQYTAFCKFKQQRYVECLDDFKKVTELIGPVAANYENMAIAYQYAKDEKNAYNTCLAAMSLNVKLRQEYFPTLLMVFADVLYKFQRHQDVLYVLDEALSQLKKQYGQQEHSLHAKVMGKQAQIYHMLGETKKAIDIATKALQLFQATCGISPLTANAFYRLGLLLKQDKQESNQHFIDSLKIWNQVDSCTLEQDSIIGIYSSLDNCSKAQLAMIRDETNLLKNKIPATSEILVCMALFFKACKQPKIVFALYKLYKPLPKQDISEMDAKKGKE